MLKLIKKAVWDIIFGKPIDVRIRLMQDFYRKEESASNRCMRRFYFFYRWYQFKRIYRDFACEIVVTAELGKVIFRHPLGIVIGGGGKTV